MIAEAHGNDGLQKQGLKPETWGRCHRPSWLTESRDGGSSVGLGGKKKRANNSGTGLSGKWHLPWGDSAFRSLSCDRSQPVLRCDMIHLQIR